MRHTLIPSTTIKSLLAFIILLGSVLRVWGIGYGLPYTYVPDEPTYLGIAINMLRTGDLNPHWWYYPSLMFYLNALALIPYFLLGRIVGVFSSPADIPLPQIITMGVGRLAMPSEFLLARGLTAAFSTAGILLVYLIGRRLHSGPWVGLFAAMLFAVSPTVVGLSQRIGPDIMALTFALLSFYFTLWSQSRPDLRNYSIAGLAAGLAIATKYNLGLILVPIFLAYSILIHGDPTKRNRVLFALGFTGLAFLSATPFALIDWTGFSDGVRFQAFSYSTEGHPGEEGNALLWYVHYLYEAEGLIPLLGLVGVVYTFVTRNRNHFLLVSYPLVYFVLVSSMLVRNTRTIVQVVPFLDLLAALALIVIAERLIRPERKLRRMAMGAMLLVVTMLVATPLQRVVAADIASNEMGERERARIWIEENLPAGSRIAQEAYTPFIDPSKYGIEADIGLIDHSPEWYRENGFEYLVFSHAVYGRYFQEPDRYPEYVAKYSQFFNRLPLVARFEGPSPIQILKMDTVPLPERRVNAKWGFNGPWRELVGYDWHDPNLDLYWRVLEAKAPPLMPSARLVSDGNVLDQTDQPALQVSETVNSLSPPGIGRSSMRLTAPPEARPGLYPVELVLQVPGGGTVPALDVGGIPISDKMLLGPLKFSSVLDAEWSNAQASSARFGDSITLARYQFSHGSVHAGSILPLTLYWQAQTRIHQDYTVFIHLLDGEGKVVAQVDSIPARGHYPTSVWSQGEIVRDEYALPIPERAAGTYTLEAGLYAYPSLERLTVSSEMSQVGDDRVILGYITVAQ